MSLWVSLVYWGYAALDAFVALVITMWWWGNNGSSTYQSIPFLGEIPLDISIREASDDGRPIVATDPDSVHARRYVAIARQLWQSITTGAATRL